MEDRLHDAFLQERSKARSMKLRWFRVNSKRIYKECYQHDEDDDHPSDFLFSKVLRSGMMIQRVVFLVTR
jgi:hypothetical protein